MRIVIIGSGFGGLNAAVELRKKLKDSVDEIIVISDSADFVFRPSLIWLPFHDHNIRKFTFPLRPTYEKIGVTFIEKRVQSINPKQKQVICNEDEKFAYDYLILASGASPDWEKIKGLEEKSESVYDIPYALETKEKLKKIEDDEPIVVGVAQQNPNPGIAYEFLFELDDYLRKRGIECPLKFFTYEKELYEGNGKETTEKLERLMEEKEIPYDCNISIKKVNDKKVYLNNGDRLPYSLLLVLPPYKGMDYIMASKNIKHRNGILPVHQTLRSIHWRNIYVVGDANNIKGTKTGRAAELQGVLAAENIVKQMNKEPLRSFQQDTMYLMETGGKDAMFIMDKPSGLGTLKWTMSGMLPHMMKRAYEKYYLLKFS